jgi:phage N-6-adenine-methyltransferase
MNTAVHFSSATDLWETPQWLFDEYDKQHLFTLDVCALPENAKCAHYFTPEQDGLRQEWTGRCWMNPPYGREIGAWVRKAYESANRGATVVCLLPARTDTRWWHEYCMKGEIRFLRGRLKFGDSKNSAPFPSAVVIFRAALQRLKGESPVAAENKAAALRGQDLTELARTADLIDKEGME